MSKRHLALAVLLLVVGGLPATARPAACRVTRDAYASLKHGMRYSQAVKILGCPGRQVTHMDIGTVRRTTYSWRGTGRTGANLNLSFRNGRLASKAQLGLH